MFGDREVICFLGDSLTASGLWVAEVFQHILKTRRVKCYNCGIAGGRAAYAVEYLHRTCLSKNPTKLVVMFGMNDIGFPYYSSQYTASDKEEKKRESLSAHKTAYERIICDSLKFGTDIILCTPLPYDEFDPDKEGENLYCQAALDECARFVLEMAEKYRLKVADIRGAMLPIIKSDKTVMTQDRMHPTTRGYHVMSQIFLSEIGEITSPDFDTTFKPEPWNHERYSVERRLKLIEFIDEVALFDPSRKSNTSIAERKAEAKRIYDSEKNKAAFLPMCCKYYLEHAEEKEMLTDELIRLSVPPVS